MNVDELNPRQRLLQREQVKHPHALAFHTDSRALAQLGQSLASGHEGPHVTRLVTPREYLAGEADGREGTHFQMRHDGSGFAQPWHEHRQRALHLVEVLAEYAAEIGARHQHNGIKPRAREDVHQRSQHLCCTRLRQRFSGIAATRLVAA